MCKEGHFKMEGWKNAEEISLTAPITRDWHDKGEKGDSKLLQILHTFQNHECC